MQDKPNTAGEDALHRFIDGRLDEDDKLDMLDYLSEHDDAATRVDSYQHQNHMLRALRRGLDVGDSRQFCPDLQARIVQQLHRPPMWRHPAIGALAASVAAIAIVTTLYVGFDQRPILKSGSGDEAVEVADATAIASPITEPVTEYLTPESDVHFPFAAEQTLAGEPIIPERPIDWFNDHMTGRTIRQPDLSGHGLTLVEVNVLAEKPTPALHLSYHDQAGQPVELFAGILSNEMRAAFNLVADGHISLHWRLGDLMFALIAPSGSPQLNNIVATVSAAVEIGAESKAAADTEAMRVEPMPHIVQELPRELVVNDLEIAAPMPDQATMMFVPVPRPTYRHDPMPVEPPQALPPNAKEQEAEAL